MYGVRSTNVTESTYGLRFGLPTTKDRFSIEANWTKARSGSDEMNFATLTWQLAASCGNLVVALYLKIVGVGSCTDSQQIKSRRGLLRTLHYSDMTSRNKM